MEASGAGPAAPFGTDQPDPEHAPVAAAAEEVIVGDAGLGESQPSAGHVSQDTPLVNATPPEAQSGVPLAEDRAAGVVADPTVRGTVAPPVGPVGEAAQPQAAEVPIEEIPVETAVAPETPAAEPVEEPVEERPDAAGTVEGQVI
jgi:hypothetical protein